MFETPETPDRLVAVFFWPVPSAIEIYLLEIPFFRQGFVDRGQGQTNSFWVGMEPRLDFRFLINERYGP